MRYFYEKRRENAVTKSSKATFGRYRTLYFGNSGKQAERFGTTLRFGKQCGVRIRIDGYKNTFDAMDVMQECIVKVYESAGNYRSRGKPMAWILTIAKNLCYSNSVCRRTHAK